MKKKFFLVTFVGAIAIIAIIFIFILCSVPTINLNKFITIKTDGYDGYGTASVVFDKEAFCSMYKEKIKIKNRELKKEVSYFGISPAELMADYLFSGELDEESELENGDSISFEWDVDKNEVEKDVKCRLKFSNIKMKVTGLKKVSKINPFDYISVHPDPETYSGYGTISFDVTDDKMDWFDIEASQTSSLSNGDSITLTATLSEYNKKVFLSKYGETPTETTKVVTITGFRELRQFNPFEYIQMTISGEPGNCQLSYIYDKSIKEFDGLDITYSVSGNEAALLKNGDTFSLKVSTHGSLFQKGDILFAQNYGAVLSKNEETYTISGLPDYVISTKELRDSDFDLMKKEVEADIYHMEDGWPPENYLKDVEYIGNYFIVLKDMNNPNRKNSVNEIDLIYKVKASLGVSQNEIEFFYVMGFSNILKDKDGNILIDLSDVNRISNRSTYYQADGKVTTYIFAPYCIENIYQSVYDIRQAWLIKNMTLYKYEENIYEVPVIDD